MKEFKISPILFLLIFLFNCTRNNHPNPIDLSGLWFVTLKNEGIEKKISLPSTLDISSIGTPVDTTKLTTDDKFRRLTRKNSYIGPAVYTREITITPVIANRPLILHMERVLWASNAKINGKSFDNIGNSLVSPHNLILKEGIASGTFPLEITIDNSPQYDISEDNLAHAYTNDTQTMWNGVLGEFYLKALDNYEVSRIEVYPNDNLDTITVNAYIDNLTSSVKNKRLKFKIDDDNEVIIENELIPGENLVAAKMNVANMPRWNEFNPNILSVEVGIEDGKSLKTNFGLRTIDNKDGLRINDVPIYLRGTLECCIYPLTGVPPLDRAGWEKTMLTAKEWGMNHLRFHSWCPPEMAFEVADSLGLYLQVELPVWSLRIGDDKEAEDFLRNEFENIVRNYGNHPSLCMISVGNELQHDFEWLNETVTIMKKRDPRHLYTTTSFTFEKGHGGHPEPLDDFIITQWTDNGWVRGQGIFETAYPSFDKNYDISLENIEVPLIAHEVGQYAVYPAMSEIEKYTGVLDPLNLKQIQGDLKRKDLLDNSEQMTIASARFAALLYKEEIERNMKTNGMSGYQLLGLQDFPGQGTASVGLVDAFWDNKGAVEPDWFRQFNSAVVPLANFPKAVYSNEEILFFQPLLANYSDTTILNPDLKWVITDEKYGEKYGEGDISLSNVAPGNISSGERIEFNLNEIDKPSSLFLTISSPNGFRNSWRIFVYPKEETDPSDIFLTENFPEAIEALNRGEKVLLAPSPDQLSGLESKFLPVFWSPVHFPKQAGTMGIMNNPDHPALLGFPNSGNSDWQWWTATRNAKVIVTDSLKGIERIVEVIDNFVNNRKLAYIFETKIGKGKLLFSSIDILNPSINDPEIRALRNSLVTYMKDDSKFNPSGSITIEELKSLQLDAKSSQIKTNATSINE